MSNWFQKLGFGLKKTSTRLTSGITDIFIKRKVDSQTLEELEDLLITSDLGVKAAQKIISSFASRRLNKDADEQEIKTELANDIETILNPCEQPFLITNEKPYVILMVGVNGAGKTTTIGKLAAKLKDKHQISLIAADTFRAAAVEQLEIWGQRNNIRVYKGPNGCDAAAMVHCTVLPQFL